MPKVELIAEVSTNAGGSLSLAKEFIQRFAEAGATWVKFQSFKVRHLRADDPQTEWFRRAELSDDDHHELKAACEAAGTKFLTTVYHPDEVPFLASLGLAAIKIGSGEGFDNGLFIAASGSFTRVIRSVHLVGKLGWYDVVKDLRGEILGCVTRYPASERACLETITRIGYYGIVGYSDHAIGLDMAKWAIESGARIIEKHVSLPNQARPVKAYEATVEEFRQLRQFADDDPQAKFIGRWQG